MNRSIRICWCCLLVKKWVVKCIFITSSKEGDITHMHSTLWANDEEQKVMHKHKWLEMHKMETLPINSAGLPTSETAEVHFSFISKTSCCKNLQQEAGKQATSCPRPTCIKWVIYCRAGAGVSKSFMGAGIKSLRVFTLYQWVCFFMLSN